MADTPRTHEPGLRELTAELDGARELMRSEDRRLESVMNERHERYKERADAAEKQVKVAFDASEKANAAANEAQKDYNQGHNDLLRKMDDQHKETLPRLEANAKFSELTTQLTQHTQDIQNLRESRSEEGGRKEVTVEHRSENQWSTGLIVTAGLALLGVLAGVVADVIVLVRPTH